jgi:nicotinamidase-related amidase
MTTQGGLSTENAVVLIIDPQEKLLPKVFEPKRVTGNIVLLIRFARLAGIPVLLTTQYEKGIGPIVEEIRKEVPEVSVVDKVEFGCFHNRSFLDTLQQVGVGRDRLLVAGIESHICVTQTVLGALSQDYTVYVASDAVSSRTEWNWKIGLERMTSAGAVISSTEMFIYEVLKRSDTPWFKEILPDLRVPVS